MHHGLPGNVEPHNPVNKCLVVALKDDLPYSCDLGVYVRHENAVGQAFHSHSEGNDTAPREGLYECLWPVGKGVHPGSEPGYQPRFAPRVAERAELWHRGNINYTEQPIRM